MKYSIVKLLSITNILNNLTTVSSVIVNLRTASKTATTTAPHSYSNTIKSTKGNNGNVATAVNNIISTSDSVLFDDDLIAKLEAGWDNLSHHSMENAIAVTDSPDITKTSSTDTEKEKDNAFDINHSWSNGILAMIGNAFCAIALHIAGTYLALFPNSSKVFSVLQQPSMILTCGVLVIISLTSFVSHAIQERQLSEAPVVSTKLNANPRRQYGGRHIHHQAKAQGKSQYGFERSAATIQNVRGGNALNYLNILKNASTTKYVPYFLASAILALSTILSTKLSLAAASLACTPLLLTLWHVVHTTPRVWLGSISRISAAFIIPIVSGSVSVATVSINGSKQWHGLEFVLASVRSSILFILALVPSLLSFGIARDILTHQRDDKHAIDTLPVKNGKDYASLVHFRLATIASFVALTKACLLYLNINVNYAKGTIFRMMALVTGALCTLHHSYYNIKRVGGGEDGLTRKSLTGGRSSLFVMLAGFF